MFRYGSSVGGSSVHICMRKVPPSLGVPAAGFVEAAVVGAAAAEVVGAAAGLAGGAVAPAGGDVAEGGATWGPHAARSVAPMAAIPHVPRNERRVQRRV